MLDRPRLLDAAGRDRDGCWNALERVGARAVGGRLVFGREIAGAGPDRVRDWARASDGAGREAPASGEGIRLAGAAPLALRVSIFWRATSRLAGLEIDVRSAGRSPARRADAGAIAALDLRAVAVADAGAVAVADPRPVAVADVDVVAVDVDVHVAAVDGDVAAIPVDVVVAVPAIPVVVVEDLVEDDRGAEKDAARDQRVLPVVVIVVDVPAVVAVVIDRRATTGVV